MQVDEVRRQKIVRQKVKAALSSLLPPTFCPIQYLDGIHILGAAIQYQPVLRPPE
jgi:hypothetical protein